MSSKMGCRSHGSKRTWRRTVSFFSEGGKGICQEIPQETSANQGFFSSVHPLVPPLERDMPQGELREKVEGDKRWGGEKMEKAVLPRHLSQDPARADTALVNAEWPIRKSEGRRGAKKS